MGWLVARLWERLTSRLVVMAVVITTITVGLLPAWNVHLVPDSVRRVFHFRFSWPYRTEYEMWERNFVNRFEDRKEEALALKARFKPGDSIVAGGIGWSDITPACTSTTVTAWSTSALRCYSDSLVISPPQA